VGFRGNKQDRLEWKKWLQRNRNLLVECGLPAELFENRRCWSYFLEHASYWTGAREEYLVLEQLSQPQRRRLCDFLQTEFGTAAYDPHALVVLKTMFGIPQRPYSSREDRK
jgi:hypothetical protein